MRDKLWNDLTAHAANIAFQYFLMARIVKLLPFAEKNTHKYGNQFTQARVDLVRYKVPMAAVVPSFLNFIVSALVGFITSPQYGIAGRPVYHSVAGT